MVEPHEWAVMEEARAAGTGAIAVLERAKSALPGHDFTPLASRDGILKRRFAYLRLGYELFTGVHERGIGKIPHHRTALYGPPCVNCDEPLRTPDARRCAACCHPRVFDEPQEPRHGLHACAPGQVHLHAPNLHRMSIAEAIAGPLPPDILGDPFLNTLADPAFALVHQLDDPSEPARLVQGLFQFYTAVLNDGISAYCRETDADLLPEVVHWCAVIGAERARSLAQAILHLYPEAVRADPVGRADFLDDLEDETGRDAPEVLAEERWDDVVEIPAQLRIYVQTELETFERAHEEGRAKTRRALAAVQFGKPPGMSEAEYRAIVAVRR